MTRFWLPVLLVQLLRSHGSATSAASDPAGPTRNLHAVLQSSGCGLNEEVNSDDLGNCRAQPPQLSLLQVSVEGFERKTALSFSEALKSGIGRLIVSPTSEHRVQHMAILKDVRFWWFMAFLIVLVGIAVVTLEVTKQREVSKDASKEAAAPKDTPAEASMDQAVPQEPSDSESVYTSETLKQMFFCVVGLNAAQIFWGISQEYITTGTFAGLNGEEDRMPSQLFLVLCNRLLSILFSAMLLGIRDKPFLFRGYRSSVFPAATNTVASWCQYWSLDYISFELQTAAKTSKLLPVVVISSLRGKQHSFQDFAEAIAITGACFVFGLETETYFQEQNLANDRALVGVALVAANVLLDAMTPHFQDVMFKEAPELDTVQATFAMSCFSSAMLFVFLIFTGELWTSLSFVNSHRDILLPLLVLSLGSTMTQYMISYTVKHFGPVVYAVISSLRQALSIFISGFLFIHQISTLAWMNMLLMVGVVILRAWRLMPQSTGDRRTDAIGPDVHLSQRELPIFLSSFTPLLVYTVGIHVFYVSYGLLQEFVAYHTFEGDIFRFPVFIVALNHAAGACLSICMLARQGLPLWSTGMWKTALPGMTNMTASILQHSALYSLVFTAQTLAKTAKIIPVMLVGSFLMKNRSYTILDYAEGLFIATLVSYFAFYFAVVEDDHEGFTAQETTTALIMMLGYVLIDAFTSNLEDQVYQTTRLDPCQLLFGMESLSAMACLVWLILTGELFHVCTFFGSHPEVVFYVCLLAVAAAFGSYTCMLTVRQYGPAVFTLIMTSRQVFSMVASLIFFNHSIAPHHTISLMVVMLLILTSSLRRSKRDH